MPILFQKGILCTSNYNDMEHKPEIDGVELNENTTKEDLDIDKVFQYRGQVATYSQLPKTDLHIGDTYNVQDTGENYAWNGSNWDCLTGAEAVYYKDSTLKSQDLALVINADNNTISNLETDNLKDGVLQTTVRDINTATDTNLASEKAIRTELNTKQNTITGAATTITSNDLTVSRALVSNANGKVAVSDITSTELSYLDGVSSNVQTQINGKVSKNGDTLTQAEWGNSLTTHTIDASLHDSELDEVVGTTSLGWKVDPTDADSVVEHLITLPKADTEGGVKYVYTDVFGSLTFVDADGTKTQYTKGKIVNTTVNGNSVLQVNYSLPSKVADSTFATTSDIGNATITFKANGSMISGQSFTTNASSDVEINLGNYELPITGAATTITSDNLTTNKALISNGSGKVAASTVSNTELGYLTNVTSNVQTQLNDKGQKLQIVELATTATITLADNTIYNGGTQTALTIAVPSAPVLGFLCEIDFSSGATATDWDDDGNLTWFGDNVANNEFTPVANTRYTIMIAYNGVNYMAIAKGIA